MAKACLMICEQTNRWAVALRMAMGKRRELPQADSLPDCWSRMAQFPASLLLIEATTENLEHVVALLSRLGREYGDARAVVFVDRDLAECQWLLWEAGAVHVVSSIRDLTPVVRLIERHLASVPSTTTSFPDSVWETLPWSEEKTIGG